MDNNISIIIPVYNCEKYIIRALESLKNQSNNNYEAIIIDDGSIDNTAKICIEYINKNNLNNFKYFYQKNAGVSSARNNGITKSNGKWIAFLDADDYLSNDFVENMNKNIDDKIDIIISNFYKYYSNENIIKSDYIIPIKKDLKKTLILSILDEKISCEYNYNILKCGRTVWGKIYNLEVIKKNNIFFQTNVKLFEDGLFNLMYLKKCKNVKYINQTLYYYNCDNEFSATKKYYPNRINDDIEKIKILNNILDKDDNDVRIAKKIFLFGIFASTLEKQYFNFQNSNRIKDKILDLRKIIDMKLYGNLIEDDIYKYLSRNKKIIFKLLKYKQYNLIGYILNIKNIIRSRV